MHGNVWDWCEDHFKAGATARAQVIRGSSWDSNGTYCRASHRGSFEPGRRSSSMGSRLAAVPSGE
jgi:formylglycine-generating enzyme required for sulfatase activity